MVIEHLSALASMWACPAQWDIYKVIPSWRYEQRRTHRRFSRRPTPPLLGHRHERRSASQRLGRSTSRRVDTRPGERRNPEKRHTPKKLFGWDGCWLDNDTVLFLSQALGEKQASLYRMPLSGKGPQTRHEERRGHDGRAIANGSAEGSSGQRPGISQPSGKRVFERRPGYTAHIVQAPKWA